MLKQIRVKTRHGLSQFFVLKVGLCRGVGGGGDLSPVFFSLF